MRHQPFHPDVVAQLFASGMIPFIGFGMTDNGLMIICGDVPRARGTGENIAGEIIEEFLGKRLGLSAMGAAAWGNLLSDMAGKDKHANMLDLALFTCMV